MPLIKREESLKIIEEGTEASLLGLKPGVWPRHINYRNTIWTGERVVRDGENRILYAVYRNIEGCILKVYND